MIIFDQLRISDDGKRLYVNAHVNNASPFNGVYIESITIMSAVGNDGSILVSETDPYCPTENYLLKKEYTDSPKEINEVFTAVDFIKAWEEDVNAMRFPQSEMSKTLFFVYIKCGGLNTIPEGCCLPCRMDEETTLGVTFDYNMLYREVMNYTRELNEECEIPKNFIDFILQWDAFKAAIDTEHYIPAINFYKNMFGGRNSITGTIGTKGCGCHG